MLEDPTTEAIGDSIYVISSLLQADSKQSQKQILPIILNNIDLPKLLQRFSSLAFISKQMDTGAPDGIEDVLQTGCLKILH